MRRSMWAAVVGFVVGCLGATVHASPAGPDSVATLEAAAEVERTLIAEALARYEALVKTGVPGVAYVRLNSQVPWPEHLAPRLPAWSSNTAAQSSDGAG